MESDYTRIDNFFVAYLPAKFSNDARNQRKFCFSLILSLLHFKTLHRYLELYYDVLALETEYVNYEFFWECRHLGLMLKNLTDHKYANLDEYYLSPTEYTIILNRCLDYDLDTVAAFKDDMRRKIADIRLVKSDNVNKYCRGDDINLTAFIREVCSRFYDSNGEGKVSVQSGFKVERSNGMVSVCTTLRNSTHHERSVVDGEGERYSLAGRPTSYINKKHEREALVEELRQLTKESNEYKVSNIKMLAFMQEMDRIFGEAKHHVNKQKSVVNSIRTNHMDESGARSFNEKLNQTELKLLDKGSNIVDKHCRVVNRALTSLNDGYYQDLNSRRADYSHLIKKLGKNINERLGEEGYKYIQNTKDKDVRTVQASLKKSYIEKTEVSLADRLLLDTTYRHVIDTHSNDLRVERLVNTTAKQATETINRILSNNGSNYMENALLSMVDHQTPGNLVDIFKKNFEDEMNRLKDLKVESDMIRRMSKFSVNQLKSDKFIIKPDGSNVLQGNDDDNDAQADVYKTSDFGQRDHHYETADEANPNPQAEFLSFQRNIDVDKIDQSAFQRKPEPIKVNKSINDMNAECEDMSEAQGDEEFVQPKTSKMIHSHIEALKQKRMSRQFSDMQLAESKLHENQPYFKSSGDPRLSQSELVPGGQTQELLPIIDDQLIDSDANSSDYENAQQGYDSNADRPGGYKIKSRSFKHKGHELLSQGPMGNTLNSVDIEVTNVVQAKIGNPGDGRRGTLAQMVGTGEEDDDELIDSEYKESDEEDIHESEIQGYGEKFLNKNLKLSKINELGKTGTLEDTEIFKTGNDTGRKPSFKNFTTFKGGSTIEGMGADMLLSMEPMANQKELKDPYSRDTKMVERVRPKLNSVNDRSFADTQLKAYDSISSQVDTSRKSKNGNKKDLREASNIGMTSELISKTARSEVYNSLNSRLERIKTGQKTVIPSDKRITNLEVSYDDYKKTIEHYVSNSVITDNKGEVVPGSTLINGKITEELSNIGDLNDKSSSL